MPRTGVVQGLVHGSDEVGQLGVGDASEVAVALLNQLDAGAFA